MRRPSWKGIALLIGYLNLGLYVVVQWLIEVIKELLRTPAFIKALRFTSLTIIIAGTSYLVADILIEIFRKRNR